MRPLVLSFLIMTLISFGCPGLQRCTGNGFTAWKATPRMEAVRVTPHKLAIPWSTYRVHITRQYQSSLVCLLHGKVGHRKLFGLSCDAAFEAFATDFLTRLITLVRTMEGKSRSACLCFFRATFFAYTLLFRNVCKSVVAVLFLEVTGIPQLSHDRTFDWPNPSFFSSETWRGHTFEVSVMG